MKTNRAQILEIVRELSGCTTKDVTELMSHMNPRHAASILRTLYREGILDRRRKKNPGVGRSTHTWTLKSEQVPPKPKLQLVQPTPQGMQARLVQAEAELRELRAWKAEAIARFPDLAVDPIILEARKIAAAQFHGVAADDILAGRSDNAPIMRAVTTALEQALAA